MAVTVSVSQRLYCSYGTPDYYIFIITVILQNVIHSHSTNVKFVPIITL